MTLEELKAYELKTYFETYFERELKNYKRLYKQKRDITLKDINYQFVFNITNAKEFLTEVEGQCIVTVSYYKKDRDITIETVSEVEFRGPLPRDRYSKPTSSFILDLAKMVKNEIFTKGSNISPKFEID